MRALLAALALLAGPAAGQTAQEIEQADAAARARVEAAIGKSGFAGVYSVYLGPRRIAGGGVGETVAGRPGGFTYEMVQPWASVTRQVVATLVMQEAEAGRMALDSPAARYLPALGRGGPTVRQLLRGRAGPRDPEGLQGLPKEGRDPLAFCLAGRGSAGAAWRYEDCDYHLLGAMLEAETGTPLADLFAQRIAGPLGLSARFAAAPGAVDDAWTGGPDAAERAVLARYGAAGGLVGTAADMAAFDRALLSGRLLSRAGLAELWREGMAAGQRSFTATLAGCTGPVRVVERSGSVGRFAVRNVILPDQGWVLVMLTNRGEPATLGEVEQGRGTVHGVLSAAACG